MSIYLLLNNGCNLNSFFVKSFKKRLFGDLSVYTNLSPLNEIFIGSNGFHFLDSSFSSPDDFFIKVGVSYPITPIVDEDVFTNNLLVINLNDFYFSLFNDNKFREFLFCSRRLCIDIVFICDDITKFDEFPLNFFFDFTITPSSFSFLPFVIRCSSGRQIFSYSYSL